MTIWWRVTCTRTMSAWWRYVKHFIYAFMASWLKDCGVTNSIDEETKGAEPCEKSELFILGVGEAEGVKTLWWLEAVTWDRGRGILVFWINGELHNLRKLIWWPLEYRNLILKNKIWRPAGEARTATWDSGTSSAFAWRRRKTKKTCAEKAFEARISYSLCKHISPTSRLHCKAKPVNAV
jgi:hypothetical protein